MDVVIFQNVGDSVAFMGIFTQKVDHLVLIAAYNSVKVCCGHRLCANILVVPGVPSKVSHLTCCWLTLGSPTCTPC